MEAFAESVVRDRSDEVVVAASVVVADELGLCAAQSVGGGGVTRAEDEFALEAGVEGEMDSGNGAGRGPGEFDLCGVSDE